MNINATAASRIVWIMDNNWTSLKPILSSLFMYALAQSAENLI